MTDSLKEKLDYARWELGNFERASNPDVKKVCLCFAVGYIGEMIEILNSQTNKLNDKASQEKSNDRN